VEVIVSTQPFHLYCSIHADDPDELARVLREIAAEINIQREQELAGTGEVLFDASSDDRSSWHFSVALRR
jgi:hypothetical protein